MQTEEISQTLGWKDEISASIPGEPKSCRWLQSYRRGPKMSHPWLCCAQGQQQILAGGLPPLTAPFIIGKSTCFKHTWNIPGQTGASAILTSSPSTVLTAQQRNGNYNHWTDTAMSCLWQHQQKWLAIQFYPGSHILAILSCKQCTETFFKSYHPVAKHMCMT